MSKTLTEAVKSTYLDIKQVVFKDARIKHAIYPFLTGTIVAVDRKLNTHRVEWDEPWLVASVFDTFNDLILIQDDNCILLEAHEQTVLKNETCPRCNGAGVIKLVSKTQQQYHGQYLVCAGCAGSKVIRKKQ